MRFHYLLPILSALIPAITSSPVEARTCPSTGIIQDPGFESGVAPPPNYEHSGCGVINFLGASTFSLTKPGSTIASGGKYAFTATVYPDPYSPQSGMTLVQIMKPCAGKNHSIIALGSVPAVSRSSIRSRTPLVT